MALEALLPSEIARLVYGYLIHEKCMETANTFLNESPSLEECRNVLSYGRHFTTRVCGYALMDILEKFCMLNSIIQEKIDKIDNVNKLKQCGDLIGQIKFLLDECRDGATLNINTLLENCTPVANESPTKSRKKRLNHNRIEDKLKIEPISNKECQTQILTNINSIRNSDEVETTLLKNLPGYINGSPSGKDKSRSMKKLKDIVKIDVLQTEVDSTNKLKEQDKDRALLNQQHNEIKENNEFTFNPDKSREQINCEIQTSEIDLYNVLVDKNIMTDPIENISKNYMNIEVQTSDIGSSESQVSSPNDCVELLNELTFELLNRTELQEKIAENINKVLEPIKSNFQEKTVDKLKNENNIKFITDFNKMVETVVHTTETDPEIIQLLNDIVQPNEEILKTDDKMDVDINSSENNQLKKNSFAFEKKDFETNDNRKSIELQKCSNENESKNIEIKNDNISASAEPMISDTVDTKKEIIQISKCNTQSNSKNNKIEQNSISPSLGQKLTYKSDNNFFTLNSTITSTPIKTFMAVQSFDACDWFSTQDLPIANIACSKEHNIPSSKIDYPFTYTASETIEASTASCLSPIICKDGLKIVEKTKDQTLHTPDIIYQPKNSLPDNSTAIMNAVPKNKTPVLHKTSEILEELLNLNTSQKSNLNVDSLPTPFKDSNDYNKLFNVDSIMLYGMDSNINTIRTPLAIPEIEVDTITLSSGFSPFLKVQKSDGFDSQIKRNEEKIITNITNEKSYEPLTIMNNTMSVTKISEFLIKNTPTKLLESRSKNNRLSLSTPKKPNNYIRALDFEMPSTRSQSESKLNDKTSVHSSEIFKKNSKNSCVSSLFQSPPITNADIMDENLSNKSPDKEKQETNKELQEKQENKELQEKKENNKEIQEKQENNKDLKEKRNKDGDKIINKLSSAKQKSKDMDSIAVQKVNIKKGSWDSDLRKYLGSDKMESKWEPSIKKEKKKIKEKQKASSKESKKTKSSSSKTRKDKDMVKPKKLQKKIEIKKIKSEIEIQNEKNDKALKDSPKLILSDNVIEVDESDNLIMAISPKLNNLKKFDENESANEISKKEENKEVEKVELKDNTISQVNDTIENVPDTHLDKKESKSEKLNKTVEENALKTENSLNYEKVEKELNKLKDSDSPKPNLQKTEVIYDHVSKVESGKVVQKKYARLKTLDTNLTHDQKCLRLSEFGIELKTPKKEDRQVPPTPQILSPGSSSLMTNSKHNEDSRTIQSLIALPLECPPTPKIIVTPKKECLVNATEKSETTTSHQSESTTFENPKKSEITQFEVIKENLFKDKNLDLQSKIESAENCTPKLDTSMTHRRSRVITESEDSNSSSSSSVTSCDTCSFTDKDSTAQESILKNLQHTDENIKKEDMVNMKSKNETSPTKVFTVNKIENEIEDIKETPAKDENFCMEADIFETPNMIKPSDNPTNLNTKISEMMILKEQEELEKQNKLKPKIISVEYVLPKIITKPPTQLLKALPLNIQLKALEVKNESNRLSMIEKLKNEKSELEVAKAVESITDNEKFKFNETIELDDKSIETSLPSPIIKSDDKNEANKIELVKAIESITESNNEIQNNSLETIPLIDENSSDGNLQLVLEEEDATLDVNKKQKVQNDINHEQNIDTSQTHDTSLDNDIIANHSLESDNKLDQSIGHGHNTRFQSRQKIADEKNQSVNERSDLTNYTKLCKEICFIFDEENYKKKRRKAFSDVDLMSQLHNEDDEGIITITAPTQLDILLDLKPKRKKRVKKIEVSNKRDSIENEDSSEDSWESYTNNNDDKETNITTRKRRRTSGFTENTTRRKRQKQNIFIY